MSEKTDLGPRTPGFGSESESGSLPTEARSLKPEARFDPELKLRVLDWVLEEQLSGRSPTSEDVARHFGLTNDRAEALREEFERTGELVNEGPGPVDVLEEEDFSE